MYGSRYDYFGAFLSSSQFKRIMRDAFLFFCFFFKVLWSSCVSERFSVVTPHFSVVGLVEVGTALLDLVNW